MKSDEISPEADNNYYKKHIISLGNHKGISSIFCFLDWDLKHRIKIMNNSNDENAINYFHTDPISKNKIFMRKKVEEFSKNSLETPTLKQLVKNPFKHPKS
jgi:hypothetical protein